MAGPLLPLEACGLDRIDEALDDLAASAPMVKKNLLFACAKIALADEQVTENETELLRAVADSIDAPLPPILPTTA